MRFAPLLQALPLAAALPKSPAGEEANSHVKRWNIHTWPGSPSWQKQNPDPWKWWQNGQGQHQPQGQGAQNGWDNQDRQDAADSGQDNGNRDGGNGGDQDHQQPDSWNNGNTNQGSQSGPGEVLTFPGSSYVDYEAFKANFVDWHNYVRSKHQDTGGLTWSEELAEDARKWSARCVYDHGHASESAQGWGQNIAYQTFIGREPNDEEKKPYYSPLEQVTSSIRVWWEWERFLLNWNTYEIDWPRARQVVEYLKERDNSRFIEAQVGHVTQMIWKETTQVGCAVSACKPLKQGKTYTVPENTLGSYTVCNYAKRGNVILENPGPGETKMEFYKQNIGQPRDMDAFQKELYNPVM